MKKYALILCLLALAALNGLMGINGAESTLPIPTDNFPYYRWQDLRDFYAKRCESVK